MRALFFSVLALIPVFSLGACAETASHRYHLMRARHAEAFALKQEEQTKQDLETIKLEKSQMGALLARVKEEGDKTEQCLASCKKKLRRLGVRFPKSKKK